MKNFASFFVSMGLIFSPFAVLAESDSSSKYKVLSSEKSALNETTINSFLEKAEVFISNGNLENAVEKLEIARTNSNLLINYYKDLHGSFTGIDALIPRELTEKNRNVIQLLAKANMQLALIHRSRGDHELAVPLLVEVVKILTPVNPRGAKAYQQLVELGLVETTYRAAPKKSL
tara:strand:- start:262 stop:786 length:525 start_codon:yes stop_codon:yes gene_type:complete